MKKLYLFIALNVSCVVMQAQNYQWAKREGLNAYDYGYGTGLDNSGNLYVAGKYEENNAVFSGTTVPCAGNHDGWLAKYDPSGALIWIRTYGGVLGDYSHAMCTDGANAVWVAGEIESGGVISFPGSTVTLNSMGDNDIIVAKYDLNGNLQWARSAGATNSEKALGVSNDNAGNVYICGYFDGSTNINGPITGAGDKDIFIAKYDANGVFQWVKTAGGPGRDEAQGIKCDASGNIYVCGMYKNGCMFGTTTYTAPSTYFDAYLAKYDSNGNLQWVKTGSGAFDDVAWGVTVDNSGKVYTSGEFVGYAVFDGQPVTAASSSDVFVNCYDAAGNLQWIKRAGGNLVDRARGIGSAGNNIYITGQFGSTATFGSNTLSAADSSDIFFAALDNNGNFLWSNSVGGAADAYENLGYESGNAICANAAGEVYATGSLLNGGVFGGVTLNAFSRTDAFVTKLSSASGIGINEVNGSQHEISVFPNPGNGSYILDMSSLKTVSEIAIYDGLGQVIERKKCDGCEKTSIDLSGKQKGIYIIEVTGNDQTVHRKKLIMH